MNKQLNELKSPAKNLVIPPIIDLKKKEKNSKDLKEEINKIILNEINNEENKESDTNYQKNVKDVLRKRREMFKNDLINDEEYEGDDDEFNENSENFNSIRNKKIKEYNDIHNDLINISKRRYEQNRDLLDITDDENLSKNSDGIDENTRNGKSSLIERVKKLFESIDNDIDYNIKIGGFIVDNYIKDINKNNLKDEYIQNLNKKIENLNSNYIWKTLFENENNSKNESSNQEHELSNNTLLQHKLYLFKNKRKEYISKPKV